MGIVVNSALAADIVATADVLTENLDYTNDLDDVDDVDLDID